MNDSTKDDQAQANYKEKVLRSFTKDGQLQSIPAQLKKKLIVLEQLAQQLELGKTYSEQEINAFIKPYHADFPTIRREFIMHAFMYRENDQYIRNPREMWARWEQLS